MQLFNKLFKFAQIPFSSCFSCRNLPGELRAVKYLTINGIYMKKLTLKCIDRANTAFARKAAGCAYLIYSFNKFQNMFVRSVILLHNLCWFIIGVVTLRREIKWLVWRLGIQRGKVQLHNVFISSGYN